MDWLKRFTRRETDESLVPIDVWIPLLRRHRCLTGLGEDESARLRGLVGAFIREKQISGAGGLEVTDRIRFSIAIQACLPILNLGLNQYSDWVEVIVYPDEFIVPMTFVDEAGVVHEGEEILAGEAWHKGPVILSWREASGEDESFEGNVVIHEFAHKLDMLTGDANGCPPLHPEMSIEQWRACFVAAYADFCDRLDGGELMPFDEYAAESPGEFFAVASEVFFEAPNLLRDWYPCVYTQLAAYFRQDPAERRGGD